METTTPSPACLDCLLVDDDPLIRLCVEMMVRSAGHVVTTAADGAAAAGILSGHEFDVLISDIRMPNLDGWGLFERLREISPKTDVILMTSYATVFDAARAEALGACDYIPKPVEARELTSRLDRISERRGSKS